MQALTLTLFRGSRQKLLKPFFRMPRMSNYYTFCTKTPDGSEKPTDDKVQEKPQSDATIIKETIKEVFVTIKESAILSATSKTEQIKQNLKSYTEKEKESSKIEMVSKAIKYAWRKTFPSHDEQSRERMEEVKKKFQEQKKEEERLKEFSNEELSELQDQIPEWKRTAVQATSDAVEEKPSLKQQLKLKIKNKMAQTELAKKIQKTETYVEYSEFRSDMKQFKHDLTDHVQNHPSRAVQASIFLYQTATKEGDIAKAIKQMRLIDPEFDLFQLEQDAKVIFENTYLKFLTGQLPELEKVCGEMALGYFKVLLKKREAEKSEPKYKYLWNVDPATFLKAFVPDSTKLPVFVFSIKAQEVYCYISKTDRTKIIDGDDERIMSMDYMFALTPHMSPSLDEVGHSWEMIEIQPREVVKMLV